MTAALKDLAGRKENPTRARMSKGASWLVIALLLIISIAPFYFAIRSAFSTNTALFAGDPDFTWLNLKRTLGLASEEEIEIASGRSGGAQATFEFLRALRNSVIIATTIAIGQVWFSAMAAYAFARLKFAGRDKIFFMYLTGLMIPPIFTLIPNLIFLQSSWLPFGSEAQGWQGSLKGVIAPFFLMTPFAVFFLRQFFLSINRSLEEAALIDGASHFRLFRSVILPIATPQMITLAVLTYVTAWNEFLWPLAMTQTTPEAQPLTVALGVFTQQQPGSAPDWSGLMTATILAALPVIILFMIFGRRIVDSIRFSGIK
jgi:multiple sugar transport system permease protein